jgi:catechol 2,3-dioxygenase-like lactoylglutathione lyase family enzyme
LVVSDLNKTLRFYCDGLGLEKRKHMPDTGRGSEIWFLGAGSSTLEIFYYAGPVKRDRPAGGRLDHTAWYVDDIRATMARLAVDGATLGPTTLQSWPMEGLWRSQPVPMAKEWNSHRSPSPTGISLSEQRDQDVED